MTPSNLLRAAGATLCLAALPCFAQEVKTLKKVKAQSPISATQPQQLTIGKIDVTGTSPYSAAAIQADSLLWLGEEVTAPDVQLATERLLQTGAFASVTSAITGLADDVTITFSVTPVAPSHLLTVGLEDFVWFTPAELDTELRRLVPLYNGTIPDSENQLYAVATALQQILATKNVKATVIRVPVQTSTGVASWVAEFRAEVPAVLIHSIAVEGVPAAFTASINAAVQSLIGAPYNEGRSPLNLQKALVLPFQNAGYQASSATILTRTIASSTENAVEVDVTASVTPGPLYHVSSITWANAPELSQAQFLALCPFRAGSIASQTSIVQVLQNVASAYQNDGFLEVAVHYSQTLDSATDEAAINITAVAGPQYTVGTVTPVNLTPAQRTSFENTWQLYPGSIYNQSYVTSYLKSHPDIGGYQTSLETVPGSNRNQVDLTLNFVKGGTFAP